MRVPPKNPIWKKVFDFISSKTQWDEGTRYAIDVCILQNIETSKMIYYACLRHLLFLYHEKHTPDFPLIYDPKWGYKIDKFVENIIVPEINAPFINPQFRQFQSYFLLGWRHKNNPAKLLTKEVFDVEARKQWKSSYWAMFMLATSLGILGDGMPQAFICGPQKDTSKIPYETAKKYIQKSPKLQLFFNKWNTLRIETKEGGEIRHLSFEKSAIEGKNPSLIILTEYHLHQDDTMQESAVSSRNTSRQNQLIIYDTTKGHDVSGVCYRREMSYKKYLEEQILKPHELHKNASIFLFCAELDLEDYDDWKNPNLWIKANPNLHVSVSLDDLIDEFNKIDSIASEIEFKIKRLGMWVGASNAYFPLKTILDSNEATKEVVKNVLKTNQIMNLRGIFGVDLSSIRDTTAVVIQWEIPQSDGEPIWYYEGMNFIPENLAVKKEKVDQVPYREWAKKGWVTFIPGDVIDYEYIIKYIEEKKKQYNINMLGYDPWQFNIIKQTLLKNNIIYERDVVPIPQGVKLTPIFKEFDRKLALKKIAFMDNLVLIDHLTNVSVKQTNVNDNILIQKVSEANRIDGFIAMLMASSLRIDVEPTAKAINPHIIVPGGN